MSGGHWNVIRKVEESDMFANVSDYIEMSNYLTSYFKAEDVAREIRNIVNAMKGVMDDAASRIWQYGDGDLWPVMHTLDRWACGDDGDGDVYAAIEKWREKSSDKDVITMVLPEDIARRLYYKNDGGEMKQVFGKSMMTMYHEIISKVKLTIRRETGHGNES